MRILIAEDDPSIVDAVKKRLTAAGHVVDTCSNGRDAYDFMRTCAYDVVIMDIMMPGEDGLSAVRRARKANVTAPVLFLTARDAVADRVAGLDAGGDDYLIKPFALDELMARVRVLARRALPVASTTNLLTLHDLTVDTAARTAKRGDTPINLTSREFALLEYLLRNQGITRTRAQIEQNLFNYDYEGASNVIDVYIRYLRKKLDDAYPTKLIHTVRGVGYVMRVDV